MVAYWKVFSCFSTLKMEEDRTPPGSGGARGVAENVTMPEGRTANSVTQKPKTKNSSRPAYTIDRIQTHGICLEIWSGKPCGSFLFSPILCRALQMLYGMSGPYMQIDGSGTNSVRKLPEQTIYEENVTCATQPQHFHGLKRFDDQRPNSYISQHLYLNDGLEVQCTQVVEPHTSWADRMTERIRVSLSELGLHVHSDIL